MPYFIRDDRLTPDEASRLNHGRSERWRVKGYRKMGHHVIDGQHLFIHSAPTVMHVECVNTNVPGVKRDSNAPGEVTASMDARDAWADQFGPGHALCWGPVWTDDPDRAPDCYFCGKPVLGRD